MEAASKAGSGDKAVFAQRLPGTASQKSSWIVYVLLTLLILMVVPPLIQLLQTSLYDRSVDGQTLTFTLEHYLNLFVGTRFLELVLNTTWYSVGSALFAIVLGTMQAWIVERTNTPLRKYVFLFSVISLGIPDVLYTISWILFFGRSGPYNEIMMFLTGATEPVFSVFGLWGMIIIEGVGWTPLAFLLISSVFTSTDASFEEASTMSGATISSTFRRITLPLAKPAVLAVAILLFIRTFESFEVPTLVGVPGSFYVLTSDIFLEVNRSFPPNYGQASAFSVGLMLIVIGMLYFYFQATKQAAQFQTITGKGYRPRPMDLGNLRFVTAAILVLLFLFIIVIPMIMIIWMSLQDFFRPISIEGFSTMTLDNYAKALTSSDFGESIGNTLYLGVGAAALTVSLSMVCAWFSVRRYKHAWLIDQLATLPIVFPSIVLGVAMIRLYLNLPFPIYGTVLAIIIASAIRYMPYGMRYAHAGILQVHTELEEASSISGARQMSTFFRIVMPLITPALVTCALFIFLIAVRSLSLPILLVGPNTQVLSVTLYTLWLDGQLPQTAAIGVIWTAVMMIFSTIFYIVSRRSGMSVR
jgi:iron(III) transport system permease protein